MFALLSSTSKGLIKDFKNLLIFTKGNDKISHPEVFCTKSFLKNFIKLAMETIFSKTVDQTCNFTKNVFIIGVFYVKFAKLFRTGTQ